MSLWSNVGLRIRRKHSKHKHKEVALDARKNGPGETGAGARGERGEGREGISGEERQN